MKQPAAKQPAATIVAVLERKGRFLTGRPLFPRPGLGPRARLTIARDARAGEGDLVLVRSGGHGRGQARIVKRIGRPDVARDVLEGLMLDRGMQRRFDPFVEREAQARPSGDDAHRRDLTALATFTIDPATARDFDDAISAEETGPGRWRVHVHIADVSAYVRPGSALDREAYRRATSVYVPGAVEPMLPEQLSNGACSLVPGQERLAVTVEMELADGELERASYYRSRIRSDERLDYDRVDRIFAGGERAADPWAAPLEAARAAARSLSVTRRSGGALAITSGEPEFEFERDGSVRLGRIVEQTESHHLIEMLMIAANEAVAGLLEDRGVPALYRVHENPDPPAIEWLAQRLASLGVPTPPLPETFSPEQAGTFAGEISVLVDEHVRRAGHGRKALTSLILRSLKQAHYTPRNVGHAGLRSPRYCHFTSPIRRYPDLVCHRALMSAVGGGEDPPARGSLEESGVHCSAQERDAMRLERDAVDVVRAFALERELFEGGWDQEFEGEIVSLIPVGAFISFGNGHEGLLPFRRMRGDWFGLNEEETIATGAESGRALRLGDPVTVAVERVDTPRGRVDLLPVAL